MNDQKNTQEEPMTENPNTEATEAPADEQQPEEQPQDDTRPSREAARYRTRLRDAEAQLEAAQGQVESMREQLLQHALGQTIDIPGDLYPGSSPVDMDTMRPKPVPVFLRRTSDLCDLGGVEKADLFAEDGSINHDAIGKAAGKLFQQRPELFNEPGANQAPGLGEGNTEYADPSSGWDNIVKGR